MKKIKNIKDLQFEKLRLRIRQLELEKQLNHSWQELRSIRFLNELEKYRDSDNNNIFTTNNHLLNGALNYGTSFLLHKLGLVAGRKVETIAEQILGKVADTLKSFTVKRKRS